MVRPPDTKTFIGASVFLLVLTICVGFWQRGESFEDTTDALAHVTEQNRQLGRDNDALLAVLGDLHDQQARDARAAQRRYDALAESEADLLRYLRAHGIDIPTRFITVTRDVNDGRADRPGRGGGKGGKDDHPGRGKGKGLDKTVRHLLDLIGVGRKADDHPGKGKGHRGGKGKHKGWR